MTLTRLTISLIHFHDSLTTPGLSEEENFTSEKNKFCDSHITIGYLHLYKVTLISVALMRSNKFMNQDFLKLILIVVPSNKKAN